MPTEKYSHKILIVEDEVAMLNALVDNLQASGFGHILQARNGEAGLALALDEKPDLIILDIVMPRMDGMTMLKKLRQDERGKDLKVILLTNLAADESITKGATIYEPSYYIIKSEHSIEDVIQKVKIVLNLEPIGA